MALHFRGVDSRASTETGHLPRSDKPQGRYSRHGAAQGRFLYVSLLRLVPAPRLSGYPIGRTKMVRKALFVFSLFALAVGVSASIATADTLPSGERNFHNATLEPAYNAENAGQIGYLYTPNKAPMMANPAAWSPLYVVVYPTSTTVTATLNCMHVPFENCPSHGDAVAGAAAQIMPSVYSDGVLGHDHVGDFPGGADFNFAWEPVLVLFTSKDAANQ